MKQEHSQRGASSTSAKASPVLFSYAGMLYLYRKNISQIYSVDYLFYGTSVWEAQQTPCSGNREMCCAWKEKFDVYKFSLESICQKSATWITDPIFIVKVNHPTPTFIWVSSKSHVQFLNWKEF